MLVSVLFEGLKRLLVHALAKVANGASDLLAPVNRNDRNKAQSDKFTSLACLARNVVAVGAIVSLRLVSLPRMTKVLSYVSIKDKFRSPVRAPPVVPRSQ